MKLCLVTGATGFVGGRLVEALLDQGTDVHVLIRPGDPELDSLKARVSGRGVRFFGADLTDLSDADMAFSGVDTVFHVGGLVGAFAPRELFYRVNVIGTEQVIDACLRCRVGRLVAVSTSDVFGIPGRPNVMMDETTPYAAWGEPYPDTKIEAAKSVHRAIRERGLTATLVYPGWVYGPGDRAFLPTVVEMVERGIAVTWGDGSRFEVPFVHIDDLVDGILAAADRDAAVGEGFLLLDEASGVTVPEFYRRLARELGSAVNVYNLPKSVVMLVAKGSERFTRWGLTTEPILRTNDVKSFASAFRFSTDKARRVLDWEPKVNFDTGLADAVDWYRKHVRVT